jgi:hypothetical protein
MVFSLPVAEESKVVAICIRERILRSRSGPGAAQHKPPALGDSRAPPSLSAYWADLPQRKDRKPKPHLTNAARILSI